MTEPDLLARAQAAPGDMTAAARILPLLDLTSLGDDDTDATIERLCQRALDAGVAAVCVYPRFVALARRQLADTPIQLATQVLESIRDRNDLDTSYVEDVILGCVAPVGEQGADIARVAAINAGYAETTAGFQINRFCASGLEAVNIAAAKVISGETDLAIGGGVESMSRVPMGADGGAWATDPAVAFTRAISSSCRTRWHCQHALASKCAV